MPSLHALPRWKPKASHAAVLLAIASLMYVPTALATPASCGAIASDSNLGTDTYDCTVSDGASVNQANGAAITYSALAGANGNVGTGKTLTNNGTVTASNNKGGKTAKAYGIHSDALNFVPETMTTIRRSARPPSLPPWASSAASTTCPVPSARPCRC